MNAPSDRATVTDLATGRVRTVKNLGWLLRHRAELIAVNFSPNGRRWPAVDDGGILTATLENGIEYRTEWASSSVFRHWAMAHLKYWPITYI